jgi:uncharacterized protein (TIGR02246 family)
MLRDPLPFRVLSGLVIVLLAGVSGSRPAAGQVGPTWAEEHMGRWYAAFNAGDAAALSRLYAVDAALVLREQVYLGRDAIEAFHKENFAKVVATCEFAIEGVSSTSRLGAVWGEDDCTGTPRAGGVPFKWRVRWLTVFQQQPDGAWLIVRDSGEDG